MLGFAPVRDTDHRVGIGTADTLRSIPYVPETPSAQRLADRSTVDGPGAPVPVRLPRSPARLARSSGARSGSGHAAYRSVHPSRRALHPFWRSNPSDPPA